MKNSVVFIFACLFCLCVVSCNNLFKDSCGECLLIYMDGHDELWGMNVSSEGCNETVSIYAERTDMSEPTPVVYGKELIISEEGNKLGDGTFVPFVYDKESDRMVAEYEDIRVVTTPSSYQKEELHPKGECQITMGANLSEKERRVWVVLV